MARIRSLKPEFWDDETIGFLSPQARLLFIATWTFADDEGLLRWTPSYLKASAFMYDDISEDGVADLMHELSSNGLIFAYQGGKTHQRLAYVINFRRHQRINRPQPGKLPPPSVQSLKVQEMYMRRDNWTCHLCGGEIPQERYGSDPDDYPSLDHLTPRSEGGSDYPSNIAAAHIRCNKSRGAKPLPEVLNDSSPESLNRSVNEAVNERVTDSSPRARAPEVEVEGKGEGEGGDSATRRASRRAGASRRALAIVEPTTNAPPAETAQTVLGAYIDWRRDQGIDGIDRRTTGLLAKQLGQAFQAGHPPDVIKRGLLDWHQRDQHPSTLASFIDVQARGGQARASPGKAQRQLDDIQQTYQQMQAMNPEGGEQGSDLAGVDRHRRQAQRELP